jgi:DNA-binding XRE family transcriptional regulator
MSTDNSDIYSKKAIGRRLLITRQYYMMSQADFAKGAGINDNTYNQYEKAKKRPSIENAIQLCNRYNITLDWIYRGEASGLRHELATMVLGLQKTNFKIK